MKKPVVNSHKVYVSLRHGYTEYRRTADVNLAYFVLVSITNFDFSFSLSVSEAIWLKMVNKCIPISQADGVNRKALHLANIQYRFIHSFVHNLRLL